MKYKCNSCGEEYPYQPVMCNDCGMPFNSATFSVIKPIKDIWNEAEVRQLCWQAYINHLSDNGTISMLYAEAALEQFEKWFKEYLK